MAAIVPRDKQPPTPEADDNKRVFLTCESAGCAARGAADPAGAAGQLGPGFLEAQP